MKALDEPAGDGGQQHGGDGPGGQQQAGLDLAQSHGALQVEGLGHHGQHLGGKGGDGGGDGQGEHRDAQQIHRQQGIRLTELAPHEDEADQQGAHQLQGGEPQGLVMGQAVQGKEKQTEGEGVEQAADLVELV